MSTFKVWTGIQILDIPGSTVRLYSRFKRFSEVSLGIQLTFSRFKLKTIHF